MVEAIETGSVPVPGGSVYYERTGTGAPLVLIHSGFTDRRLWDPQFTRYSADYTVIRYDVRGHGRSPIGDAPHDDAKDLAALLDALQVRKCFLLGNSKGARIASAFAAATPERVLGLVLVGGGPGDIDPTPEEEQSFLDTLPDREEKILALAQAGRDDEAVSAILAAWAPAVDEPTRTYLRTVAKENLDAMLDLLTENAPDEEPPYNVADKLRHSAVPTLLVVGERDHPAVRMMLGRFAQQLPRANFVVLPEADHTPNLSAEEAFDRVVLNFLDALPTE